MYTLRNKLTSVPQTRINKRAYGFLVLVILVFLLAPLRFLALGRFVTADEPAWGKRSANFYYALSHGDYASTYQTGHPGVITMWIGAAAYLFKFPEYRQLGKTSLGDNALIQIFKKQGVIPLEILVTARLITAAVIAFTLLVSFYCARQLFGTLPSLLGFVLITFDPFHLAHSRIFHTNGLVSSFMFLSLLAYLCYLKKRSFYFLILSGIAAGLSILTVKPGLILAPVILLLAVIDLLVNIRESRKFEIKKLLQKVVLPIIMWVGVCLMVIFLLWPALWVNPVGTVIRITPNALISAKGVLDNGETTNLTFTFKKLAFENLIFYPKTYLWRGTPVVMVGVILAILALAMKKQKFFTPEERKNLVRLLIFVVSYTIIISFGLKKFDRYLLPIYLPLDLIAGVGWISTGKWLSRRNERLKHVYFTYVIISLVAAAQIIGTVKEYPYYLTYYNPLMGGTHKASEELVIGWGEGLNEAALYLKGKPGIKKKKIKAWYPLAFNWYSSSLGYEAEPIYIDHEIGDWTLENYLASDYLVVYVNQWQRNMPNQLMIRLESLTPEHTIWIKDTEYVRIYNLDGCH